MKNFIALGDNLQILKDIPDKSVALHYWDPLFNSNKVWTLIENSTKEIKRFEDIWVGGAESYIYDMIPRIKHAYRTLEDTGNIVIHCDTNLVAEIRIMLNNEFGRNCFRNQIPVLRTQGPFADSYRVRSRSFGKQHDYLVWYSKHPTNYKSHIIAQRPWSENEIKTKFPEKDEKGIYGWERQYSEIGKKFKERLNNDELKKTNAGYYYKRYYHESLKGNVLSDIWIDIKPIAPGVKTKKWPTEKTEEIFEILIPKLTDPGDVVLEAYMGAGPACAVAAKLGRKFIGIDISPIAFSGAKERLNNLKQDTTVPYFEFEKIKSFYEYNKVRGMDPFEFETLMINELASKLDRGTETVFAFPNPPEKQRGDGKIDGLILEKTKLIPVQVKRQDKIDGNTITVTMQAAKDRKCNKAYVIAFSFSPEAKTFSKKYEIEEKIKIKLIHVDEILNIVYPIDVKLSEENSNVKVIATSNNENCESMNYTWIIFYNKGKNSKVIKEYSHDKELNLNDLKTFNNLIEVKCLVSDNCGGIGEDIIKITD